MPSGTLSRPSPSPTAAGIPSERARIALCDVGLPATVAMPSVSSRSSEAVSGGVRSVATTIPVALKIATAVFPVSAATTWRATPFRSSARASRYSSSRPR